MFLKNYGETRDQIIQLKEIQNGQASKTMLDVLHDMSAELGQTGLNLNETLTFIDFCEGQGMFEEIHEQ